MHKALIRSKRLREIVDRSPLGPYIDGFVETVGTVGYTPKSLRDLVLGATQFARYLSATGVKDVSELRNQHIEDFVATLPVHRCRVHYRMKSGRGGRAAHHLLRYLRKIGVTPSEPTPERIYSWILREWLAFLQHHRGLTPDSLALYRRHLERFLRYLGADAAPDRLASLSPESVRSYLRRQSPLFARATRRNFVITLRSFLRFAFSRRYLARDLVEALERVPCFTLDRLPRGPKWQDLEKLLDTVDRSTAEGRRDFAILIVLITYGIRAGQLVGLRLENVHWRENTILFPAAKGGRRIEAPLMPAVGNAMACYLREGRPTTPERQVFLSLHPPYSPLAAGSIYNIVARAFKRAQVSSPHLGSHAIRHAWATRAMAQGQTLKTIADLLGHRCLESTRIYTKVDTEQLRSVGLPWPQKVEL
jgi:site-specific recombinase XerD